MDEDALVESAWQVRERAYAPYSKFQVGAALLADDGRVFTGCNVENLSFGLTMCAERVAIANAIAAGARGFAGIVVVADTAEPVSPCGACRQVMAEFEIKRIVLANRRSREAFTLDELLPRACTGILDRA
jgi:cytidine deaminase